MYYIFCSKRTRPWSHQTPRRSRHAPSLLLAHVFEVTPSTPTVCSRSPCCRLAKSRNFIRSHQWRRVAPQHKSRRATSTLKSASRQVSSSRVVDHRLVYSSGGEIATGSDSHPPSTGVWSASCSESTTRTGPRKTWRHSGEANVGPREETPCVKRVLGKPRALAVRNRRTANITRPGTLARPNT